MAAADQQAVLDHLDEVIDQTRLLPADQRLRVLDTAVTRLQSAQADAVRAFEADGGLDGTGCTSTGSWVRLFLRRGTSGYRLTRRAQLLPALPGFAAAFAAGDVTDEHVDTVIRWTKPCGLEAIQTHETTLVDLAKQVSAKELDQALEAIADLVSPDRDADKVAALAQRSITVSALGDLVHVDAMIEASLGEALKTAIEAGAVLPKGISRGDDGRTLAQRRADAFGEIVMAGIGITGTDPTESGDSETAAASSGAYPVSADAADEPGDPADDASGESGASGSAADASGDATDSDSAGGDDAAAQGTPKRPARRRHTGRLRPQVALTVGLDWLAGTPGAPQPLLAHFGTVPSATAHRLICDGDLVRVIVDTATGKPLNVGRRHRLALKRQRRALATVFRRCAFPGCEVPFRFCEIHHRDWWCRDHGGTDLDLLLPYCWSHHHFLHEYGFTVTTHTTTDDGTTRLVHRRPDGRQIPDPHQPLHTTIEQLRLHYTDTTHQHPWPHDHPPDKSRHPPDAA